MSIDNPDLRFQCIEEWLQEQVANIAQHKGISMSDFLKPVIRDLVSRYPEHLRSKKQDSLKSKPIKVSMIPKDVQKEFNQLVENFGGNPSYFLKIYLFHVVSQYPEHMKKPINP